MPRAECRAWNLARSAAVESRRVADDRRRDPAPVANEGMVRRLPRAGRTLTMPYALLDDQYHSNPKVIAMGLDGAGLYSRALSYCADYLTDGLVPVEWASAVVGRKKRLLDHLVDLGAWQRVHIRDRIVYTDRTGNEHELDVKVEGFWIADYTMFNPSRTEYESTRKRKSHAGRKGAVRRWGDSRSHDTSHGSSDSSSHQQTASRDVENPGESMAAAMAAATPPACAPARTPSPTPLLEAAVAGTTPDTEPSLAPDDDAAAAPETDEELEALLDELALPGTLRDRARHEPDRAKAVAVYTLANHGSGAYFRTVFDSGDHPVTTANGAASTPAEWCDRFVNATGYLLPDDELEYQLREHGADESQITGYMERAAALRGEPAL